MTRTSLRAAAVAMVVACCAAAPPACAFYELDEAGARAQGMGTAAVAMIDDVSAFAWNPAALDRLSQREVLVSYGDPVGTSLLYAGALAVGGRGPGPLGGFGTAFGWRRTGVRGVHAEDLWQVSAGREVARSGSGYTLSLGGSLKLGRVGFASYTDPDLGTPVDYGSRSQLGFDTAALVRTPWKVDAAWVASDWTEPEYDFIPGGGDSRVARRHRVSAAYHWNPESTIGATWTSPGARGGSRLDLGIEVWFFGVFAIRSGLTDLGGLPDPGSSAQRFQYAGGVGLRDKRWRVDAAVATNRDLGASYRFSLVVPIGSSTTAASGTEKP